MSTKIGLIGLAARALSIVLFPFLSHRAQYGRHRILGLAFTARNRGAFKYLGDAVFLSSDLVLHLPEFIEIGDRTGVGRGCSLTVWRGLGTGDPNPLLAIGEACSIGEGAHITAVNRINIGNNVLLGKHVTISDNNHGDGSRAQLDVAPARRALVSKGPVVIEDNVWIGDKATVLAGLTVGRGAVVAANSVVTTDVPPASVVAGVPAKVVKMLD